MDNIKSIIQIFLGNSLVDALFVWWPRNFSEPCILSFVSEPGMNNTSSHLYQPYGHVITGGLSIIPNSTLRDLIAKGRKNKEPCKVDWDKNLSLLCDGVYQYALQWAKWEMVELSVLSS